MNSHKGKNMNGTLPMPLYKKRLSECSEQDALQLMRSFDRQITFWHKQKSNIQEARSFWKTPYPYVGIGVGIIVPVSGFMLLMLLP